MSENNSCAISFDHYKVNELLFKLNEKFNNDGNVNLSPEFTKEINKTDNDKYIVTLAININGENLPFKLATSISGYFAAESSEFSEQLIHQNAVAILFPYLRSLVSSLTVTANIKPVILPTLNIVKMFEEETNKKNNN
jgi:preprotein translocase subunit SecB